ncbi:Hypothetical predicted protein [Pelobates cultripes]|uniref:Uncharacterized protein n=1 Tax=Pelobates cultripes TaxID=61616 RepID=A0AAD1WMW0_PELCU|nr:Hypothetical predicted protein [Pelobates cultripes]
MPNNQQELEQGTKHHKRTPVAITVQLSRSTSSTTKIRKSSPADWSIYRNSCMPSNQQELEQGTKHHKRTPEVTTGPLSRSTTCTTKIRKSSPADWSRYRISCMQKNQA